MGNTHSSTPRLTKNRNLSSPPVTPILSSHSNKSLTKNTRMEEGNEVVEDSLLEDKENDGRISRERSLVGTPISTSKIKQPSLFTPQTRKERENWLQRRHSNISNSSLAEITTHSDSDSAVIHKEKTNTENDNDATVIILDSDNSDSDITLDEEDDIIKSEDDEEESDNSFIVDDAEGENFIESYQQSNDHCSVASTTNGFTSDSDSIVIDESVNKDVLPQRRNKFPRRKNMLLHPQRRTRIKDNSLTPSKKNDVDAFSASEESDSDVTLDEEDDIMKSEDDEESDNSFIVEDEEDNTNFIETNIQSSSDESFMCDSDESIRIDESLVKQIQHKSRRKTTLSTGAGSHKDPIIISGLEEDLPCSSKSLRNRKPKAVSDVSCIIIEDSDDENSFAKRKSNNQKSIRSSMNGTSKENPITIDTSFDVDSYMKGEKRLFGGKMSDRKKEKITAVTEEVIKQIHGTLDTMPENVVTETPEDLTVDLMLHQKHGLTWMKWRENQKLNRGGILADDMGLGKTLSMISLIVSQKNDRKNNAEVKENLAADMKKHFSSEKHLYPGYCTLVVAPASVIYQWEKEIKDRVKQGKLKVYVFHGPKRQKDPRILARNDIVITTYNTIASELGEGTVTTNPDENFIVDEWFSKKKQGSKKIRKHNKKSVLAQIGWERIILDEAHNIKNRKSLMSKGCCALHAFKRWALTGTPIHNELWDFYSLIKFLRILPFSDQGFWKVHMSDMSGKVARQRLNTLVKSILLRRTKQQICSVTNKPLVNLKPRTFEIIEIQLDGVEAKCYQQMMEASQQRATELINQQSQQNDHYLIAQRQQRNKGSTVIKNPFLAGDREIGAGNFQMMSCLLVLLLRLRQACVHMALTKQAVDLNAFKEDGGDVGDDEDIDEVEKTFGNISLSAGAIIAKENDEIDKIFEPSYVSGKLKVLLERIDHVIESGDKCVIVSQWTSMLEIVEKHLKKKRLALTAINGKILTKDRQERIDLFNQKTGGAQVMLLSLTAGGVGLNLVGGNHLFLLDLHWNPALEQQAFDRIYRVGQTKNVFIHKLICKNTVEQRVLEMQESKVQLAASVLEGAAKKMNKLSVNDLKYLFGLAKE